MKYKISSQEKFTVLISFVFYFGQKKNVSYRIIEYNTSVIFFSVKNFLLNENIIMIYGTINNELLVCIIDVNKMYYIVFTIIF
jgi:hypothetical protein